MPTNLMIALAALSTGGAAAPAADARCDAKPFTLTKPTPPQPKPAVKVVAKKPAAAPKPKLVIGCKQPVPK